MKTRSLSVVPIPIINFSQLSLIQQEDYHVQEIDVSNLICRGAGSGDVEGAAGGYPTQIRRQQQHSAVFTQVERLHPEKIGDRHELPVRGVPEDGREGAVEF